MLKCCILFASALLAFSDAFQIATPPLASTQHIYRPSRLPFEKSLALHSSNDAEEQEVLGKVRPMTALGLGVFGICLSLVGLHAHHSSVLDHLAAQADALVHCNMFIDPPVAPQPPEQAALPKFLLMLGKASPPPPAPSTIEAALSTIEAGTTQVCSALVSEAENAMNSYNEALRTNYDVTTAIQAFVLVGIGDLIAQTIEMKAAASHQVGCTDTNAQFDPIRTFRMGSLGLLIGGIGTSHWLKWLESELPGHAAPGPGCGKSLDRRVFVGTARKHCVSGVDATS